MTGAEKTIADIPMVSGIYKITSPSGKIYIGQSTNLRNRWLKYYRLHCKNQTLLLRSLKKHGFNTHAFEVLCLCPPGRLDYLEREFIKLYDSFNTPHGLNSKIGGNGNGTLSDETKRKIGLAHKGKIVSAETRKLQGDKKRGKKLNLSDEQRKAKSERMKGKQHALGNHHTEEHKKRVSLWSKWNKYREGTKLSEEHKLRIGSANKGKKISEEHKLNISAARKKLFNRG